jgi:hypothetical protein
MLRIPALPLSARRRLHPSAVQQLTSPCRLLCRPLPPTLPSSPSPSLLRPPARPTGGFPGTNAGSSATAAEEDGEEGPRRAGGASNTPRIPSKKKLKVLG